MSDLVLYSIRILLAVTLGFAIGWERRLRIKEAGIRTHAIVSCGSALIMIISKYGFTDVAGDFDGTRIAAQIVSGIGFLGAGIIVHNKGALRGLTTAAGIWVTSGIGMCVGCGMWELACVATVVIIVLQVILHLPVKFFETKRTRQLEIVFEWSEENYREIMNYYTDCTLASCCYKCEGDGIICSLTLTLYYRKLNIKAINGVLKKDYIRGLNLLDET